MSGEKHVSNGEPAICVGNFDFNTSSTIELTGIVYEVQNGEKTECSKTNEESRESKDGTSDLDALLHVVKSSLGTGVLASAYGFKNAGMVIGIVGTIIVGLLCTHCTHIMVRSSQQMCALLKKSSMGYGEAIEASFSSSSNRTFRKYSSLARKCADGLMFFTYYGVTTVYIILISTTLKQVVGNHTGLVWDIRIYILIVAIPVFMVGMIRNMKYLVPFSAFANLCLFVGLVLIFYYVLKDMPSRPEVMAFAPPSRLPLFFATVLFGMEGIGTMLPIENSMRQPQHFLGCPGVLNFSMAIVVSLFMIVGLLGYIRFGEGAADSITLSLGNDIFSEVVKVLVALAILFSYGLQLTAAIDVVWRGIHKKFSQENQTRAYYITRSLLITGTVIIAIAMPDLGPVISLIGAVGFSTCGFFFPALSETAILAKSGYGRFNWILWKNGLLVLITILAAVSGAIVSISDIIKSYTQPTK